MHYPQQPDQHIADLRKALEEAVRWIYFCAGGREAAHDPEQSAALIAAAAGMQDVLARTAPPE